MLTNEFVLMRNFRNLDEALFQAKDGKSSLRFEHRSSRSITMPEWFGGTKERNPDVEIWMSRRVNNKWTKPLSVANGVQNDTLR